MISSGSGSGFSSSSNLGNVNCLRKSGPLIQVSIGLSSFLSVIGRVPKSAGFIFPGTKFQS